MQLRGSIKRLPEDKANQIGMLRHNSLQCVVISQRSVYFSPSVWPIHIMIQLYNYIKTVGNTHTQYLMQYFTTVFHKVVILMFWPPCTSIRCKNIILMYFSTMLPPTVTSIINMELIVFYACLLKYILEQHVNFSVTFLPVFCSLPHD